MRGKIVFLVGVVLFLVATFGITIAQSMVPQGDFCNTTNWEAQRRYNNYKDHADFHNINGSCYAHTSGKGFGWGRVVEKGTPFESYDSNGWVCVDYEVPSNGQLTGWCSVCDGSHGYEPCVAASSVWTYFYDENNTYLGRTLVGTRLYGVGEVTTDASYSGQFTTDNLNYSVYSCNRSGKPTKFYKAPTTSKHKFVARLSEINPLTQTPKKMLLFFGFSYSGSYSVASEVKLYQAYVGTPESQSFCDCLGGVWNTNSSSCDTSGI